jgi:hypothetical protein
MYETSNVLSLLAALPKQAQFPFSKDAAQRRLMYPYILPTCSGSWLILDL